MPFQESKGAKHFCTQFHNAGKDIQMYVSDGIAMARVGFVVTNKNG